MTRVHVGQPNVTMAEERKHGEEGLGGRLDVASHGEAVAIPAPSVRKTGKAKRREKRLRNEPQSVSGRYASPVRAQFYL